MDTQQRTTLRNNTKRKIERRGMNRLLEEETIDEILSFAFDFPSHEDEAVDLLLDFITNEHTSSGALGIDNHLVHWAINRLRAADSAVLTQQNPYLESDMLEETREDIVDVIDSNDLLDADDEEMWMHVRQFSLNDLSLREGFPFSASKSAIQALPDVFAEEDFSSSWVCGVCLGDEIEANDGAKQMPCKHIFHTHCIVSWLELQNSCPLCRYQLPT